MNISTLNETDLFHQDPLIILRNQQKMLKNSHNVKENEKEFLDAPPDPHAHHQSINQILLV